MILPAYFNRADTRQLQKRYREVIVDYEQATARDPNFAWAYSGCGLVRLLQNQEAKGQPDFSQALKLDPPQNPTSTLASQIFRPRKLRLSP